MSSAALRRRTLGVARYLFVIVLGLVAIGGGVIFWLLKAQADVDEPAPTAVAAAGPAANAGTATEDLLQQARQAIAQQRLLAPVGNNAFELYLTVLKREPGNRVAQDALREIFPFAAQVAEQTIDQGDDAEAQRQIDLLTRADPKNYTLTLLQTKLQAQRDAAAQQAAAPAPANKREQAPAVVVAAHPAAVVPAPTVAPPSAAPVPQPAARSAATPTASEQAIAQLHVESTSVEAAPRSAVHVRAPAPVATDASGAAVPVLTSRVEPAYPVDARRMRRQGWVDVTFTVQPNGTVTNASVADADPKYVFDRAALSAVARWQFTPGMQGGKPVAAQVRQRIEFRL
jgi:periplasmic protein TonB